MTSLSDIKSFLQAQFEYEIFGDEGKVTSVDNISLLETAQTSSICWLAQKEGTLTANNFNTNSSLIICSLNLKIEKTLTEDKVFLLVKNPRLVFAAVANEFFSKKASPGIHPSVDIHPEAVVAETVSIGPFSVIGKCEIGDNSIIRGNSYIDDDVTIGKNVIIEPNCVIGASGSGYARMNDGLPIPFPQIGKTIIEDYVEIGAKSYVARGALGFTKIGRGTKIGLACMIGHNVNIGINGIILANTLIAGSAVIGDEVYIAPSVTIRNKVKIGDKALIGMGALVLKNVGENETVMGSPAEPMRIFLKKQKILKEFFEEKTDYENS